MQICPAFMHTIGDAFWASSKTVRLYGKRALKGKGTQLKFNCFQAPDHIVQKWEACKKAPKYWL